MIRITNEDPSSPIEYGFDVSGIVTRQASPFQEILIVDSPRLGRVLLLDGAIQYCTLDEFFYHEMAAHVPLLAHPDPHRVVIVGGGDGGVLREVLRHDSVKDVLVVEIDEQIIETARAHLPGAEQAFADPRVGLRIMDGAEFVQAPGQDFDVMIVDGGDYTGFARNMVSRPFIDSAAGCLRDLGILVIQSGSLHFHRSVTAEIQALLAEAFKQTDLYTTTLPSFPGNWWSFSVGSTDLVREPLRAAPEGCRFYDADMHRHAFPPESLCRRLREGRLDWPPDPPVGP